MEKILVDKNGYKQFYQEIERIKEELTNNASKGGEAYKDAIGDGWHDNFAFKSAMAEERKIRAKLEKMYSEQSKLEIIQILELQMNISKYVIFGIPSTYFFKKI